MVVLTTFWLHCEDTTPFDVDIDANNTDSVVSDSFSYQIEVDARNQLRLEGINGEVTVRGVEAATTVKIEGERRVGSETIADATAHLAYLQVKIEEKMNEIAVETRQPSNSHGRSYVVDYSITVPRTFKVRINNVNGTISVSSIKNDVGVENVNGGIVLSDINSNATAHLVNGQISGFIILPLNGTVDMNLVNGNIDLDIPKETSAEFTADVTNGQIRVSNMDLHDIIQTPRSFKGICGEGRGDVSLRTVNGNIGIVGL
jgi:DUF4097 and DUF4098 domain-containing protein YvlB